MKGNKKKPYDIETATGVSWVRKKRYRYLYQMACQKGVIRKAFQRMKRKKTKRHDIQKAEENLDEWVDKIQQIILNTKPDGWEVEHPELAFVPPKHKPMIIHECGKDRIIYVPTIEELWIQYVIVMILEPIILGGSYHHSYSSFPGRGAHKGKNALKRWIRSGKGVKYFAQCDIRHFYGHVQYRFVREKLARKIHDSFFLHLIDVCMMHFPKQLPLGFFLSQWMANFILQELDHSIKQELKILNYLRYMDNLTLGSDNKKTLRKALVFIRQWLGKIRLRLKTDWQIFRFEFTKRNGSVIGRAVKAMGWMFHRERTTLVKHTLLHISDIAQRLHRKKEAKTAFPVKLCRGMMSLMGYLKHSDTYGWYLERVKPFVNIRTIKRIISKTDKKEVHRNASGMEKRRVQCPA